MAFILIRDTEVAASFIKFKIEINNEDVGKIAQGEEKEFTLPEEESVLQIKQFGSRSNKLVVNDGDYIEISNASWFFWEFVSLFILGIIVSSFEGPAVWTGYALVIVGYFVFNYFVESIKLTKRNKE
ncbi:hypothetical protein SAMN04488100_1265 [Alkalibacterium putridalgicola]|uniref:Uncharacterized protein n=1 Tax=Alkalibacterium putridalgicola TaxID=426703 RepID=A0A1H7VPR4_9LACT|nr:hypothetical protein [Alkalibacterium putridalgicola]GEK89833.1 hypothetical protein APU01nite_18720 [Alkalibacterium putridalgicola]SEM10787.1 hypothetical protein SAMN04488100_1265 [Alkalibacterium putridalgicola]